MAGSRKKRSIVEDEIEKSVSELALDDELPHRRRLEALGVGMMLGAVAMCFALFSFDPSQHGDNLVGPLGEQLARILLGGVGVVGYLAALMSVLGAGATLLGKLRFPSVLTFLSAAAITAGATMLAHLMVEPDLLGHPAGGLIGALLTEAISSVAGPAGAALVSVGAVLIGVLGIADVSIGRAMIDTYRGIRWAGIFLFGSAQIYSEAKQAGRTREIELIEAARSRRAMKKIEAEERERALRVDLEEKARLAVLKATAKAEERALVKIAALEAKERAEKEPVKAPVEEVEVDEPLENPADVIEEIDRHSVRPKRALPAPIIEEKIREEKEEKEEIEEEEDDEPLDEDEGEDVEIGDDEEEYEPAPHELETEAAVAVSASVSEGPMIHDRLTLDTNFDEEEIVVEEDLRKEFVLPPINLLDYEGDPPEPLHGEMLRAKATRLEEKLKTYGVEGRVTAIRPGPVVTTYEYQPAPGVKVAKIANLCDDIAMSMEALRVRIVAPIPGRGVVGIELPNERRENVYLKELIAHDRFKRSKSLLTLALGKDAEGNPVVRDLKKMPHLLVAGTTGSGKSVSINTMILSILYKATPDQVKFIMVDPKMLELSLYNDIPHLLLPVVTDPRHASLALAWAVDEMERRYQLLSDAKVRDIDGFNRRIEKLREKRELGMEDDEEESGKKKNDPWHGKDLPPPMPYIMVLIDEFADLMCVAPRDVEGAVQRLAQKARAAGIHVLLATQRPSTDVITGVIKNNFPSRISFRVASRHDSATILNSPGAENLLGMGDSLVLDVASPVPERVHGGYVSETEVERVVDFWKAQARPKYDPDILKKRDEEEAEIDEVELDEMYDMAVRIVTETKKCSISAIQRRLRVGYNRAARMVELMERQGIVGPAVGPKGEREVLVNAVEP